ncbi:phosphoheptose isomerase [Candidatus Aerophobetes bacterium]|uniref:Phosphoheptose isomerase n=1 Tax=Aerophobetes bacterium TaxID=2030807 RepID=A0A2A4YGR5_UNCAE|nr:MAG: phosphoheptose isomerase [Candidatus Aerophobetes bacterium]
MKEAILHSAKDAVKAAKLLLEDRSVSFIESATLLITSCYKEGGKLLIAGNGGSLCDAMHFAEELTGYYREKRAALAAVALSDPGHMSCVANDTGFDEVFVRSVEALARPGDILIVLTTSGNSKNLHKAVLAAKKKKINTIAFLGKTGGCIKGLSDLEWIVEGFKYSDRIQEVHMAAIHMIIEMVEKQLFDLSLTKSIEPPLHSQPRVKAHL